MINTTSSEKIAVPTEEAKGEEKKKKKKNKKMIWIFLILVVIFIWLSNIEHKTNPDNKTGQETSSAKLALSIGYEQYVEGYTVPVLTIKNQSDVRWESCRLKLNSNYEKTLPMIHESSYWNLPEITGNKFQIIPVTQFTKSDGTKFNPLTMVAKDICVSCDEPNYDINCWSW